jgi:outer membrane protein insertion porin family
VVDVKEAKTGAFSFGGGYSTVDQFIGFVEVEQKNFDWRNWPYFTGAGQDLKLRASFGTLTQDFDLSFTEPWVFDYPVSFGFDGYRRTRDREEDVGYGYDQRITGGDLRLGRELTDYLRTDLTYRLDRIEITNISEDATFDLNREEGKNNISSIEPSLTFDSRDNVFIPTKGNLITSSWQYAGGPLAGDKDFWKFYARASHYIPLFRGSVLEFRGRVGLADPYGDSPVVPIYERFFAGGANTIRGYHERKIGPIDSVSKDPLGGESTVIGNLEYTYPIWSFLRLAAFYDTGNVWKKIDDIDFGDLKSGIGFGVRLKTPMGPVLVDYGIPLDKEPGEDKKGGGQFHFSMSHGF